MTKITRFRFVEIVQLLIFLSSSLQTTHHPSHKKSPARNKTKYQRDVYF